MSIQHGVWSDFSARAGGRDVSIDCTEPMTTTCLTQLEGTLGLEIFLDNQTYAQGWTNKLTCDNFKCMNGLGKGGFGR
jgi:hypothetical protein